MTPRAALALVVPLALSLQSMASGVGGGSSLDYRACFESETFIEVPAALLAGEMPPGFVPVGLDPLNQVVFVTDVALACRADDGGPVTDNVVFVFVTPPPELQMPGADFYLLFLDVKTSSPASFAVYEALGFGPVATLADVSLATLLRDEHAIVTRSVADDGTTRIETVSASVGEVIPYPGAHLGVFGARGGQLHGIASASYSDHAYLGAADSYVAAGYILQQGPGPFPEGPTPVLSGHEFDYDLWLGPP